MEFITRHILKIVIFCLAVFWLWGAYDPFRFAKPATIGQSPIESEAKITPFGFRSYGLFPRNFIIEPRLNYDITARVLHKQAYYSHHLFGDILPYDILLGWKGMSDLRIIRPYMSFDHVYNDLNGITGRFGRWQYHWDQTTPQNYIEQMVDSMNKSNNHLIPANAEIFRKLWRIDTGDIVRLQGYLVDIEWPEHPGWIWKTALDPDIKEITPTNEHNHDCQTIFVTSVTIN